MIEFVTLFFSDARWFCATVLILSILGLVVFIGYWTGKGIMWK